jgi:hypothetical protein
MLVWCGKKDGIEFSEGWKNRERKRRWKTTKLVEQKKMEFYQVIAPTIATLVLNSGIWIFRFNHSAKERILSRG